MRNLFGPRTLLLSAASLAVPSLPAQSVTSALMPQGLWSQNCPVAFSAGRQGGLIARTRSDEQPGTYHLHLRFGPADTSRILEIKGVVHGFTAAPHSQPAGQFTPQTAPQTTPQPSQSDVIPTSGPRHREQSFHLTGGYSLHDELTWDLRVHQVPVISSIDLLEIRMTDGTVWHPSAASTCRVTPDGYMLVAGSH